MFQEKLQKTSKHTLHAELRCPKIASIIRQSGKKARKPDRTQMTIQRDTERLEIACRITKARIQAHIFIIINILSTATMVMGTRLNVTVYLG